MSSKFNFQPVILAGALVFTVSMSCFARVHRRPELATRAYAHAVELQKRLKAEPDRERTRAQYERVIREYRDVYLWDFASTKAPLAAEAIGDLYAEMGRLFVQPDYFRSAIKSYKYVISQYPASTMARRSWISLGKVYFQGLNDPDMATETFHAFLEKHPSSDLAGEARENLKEIAEEDEAEKQAAGASSEKATTKGTAGARPNAGPVEVTEIHDWVGPNYTRVVIGARGPFKYDTLRLSHPDRIVFDLANTHLDRALLRKKVAIDGDFLRDIRVGQFKPNVTRIVLDVKNIEDYSAFPLPNPFRLIIDVHGTTPRTAKNEQNQPGPAPAARDHSHSVEEASASNKTPLVKPEIEASSRVEAAAKRKAEIASNHHSGRAHKEKTETASNHGARRDAKKRTEVASLDTKHRQIPISTRPASPIDGSQTLTRALGLKVARIVIDPGHGGFDTGTIGPTGLEEKNVVLDVALRLRRLFETRTNSKVFMTRTTDKFVPLEERTAFANEKDADLFISIHANASPDHYVRGVATYFLNFTTDPYALNLAARENATSQESVHQLQTLIKKIALNNKIEESQELARDIQTVLYRRLSRISPGIRNRGVRKAPFVVLIGANMPSVLAEISFLSNPHSEHLLREPSYREDIAKALFHGIEDYVNNLGSVRVAQRTQ